MTDLDLIPTEDLLKALKRRYDQMVFAGIKDMGGDQCEAFSARTWSSIHLKQTLTLDRKSPIFVVAALAGVACEQISRLLPTRALLGSFVEGDH